MEKKTKRKFEVFIKLLTSSTVQCPKFEQINQFNVFYRQFEKKTPRFDINDAMNGDANHHVIEKNPNTVVRID